MDRKRARGVAAQTGAGKAARCSAASGRQPRAREDDSCDRRGARAMLKKGLTSRRRRCDARVAAEVVMPRRQRRKCARPGSPSRPSTVQLLGADSDAWGSVRPASLRAAHAAGGSTPPRPACPGDTWQLSLRPWRPLLWRAARAAGPRGWATSGAWTPRRRRPSCRRPNRGPRRRASCSAPRCPRELAPGCPLRRCACSQAGAERA
mmetsp:Transcript_55303/g.153136  ORF Transcript_55303/g.153136 Transcript_55303/m.153136 type:complete len:206 (+) Transcript_55303:130-747(+)